MQPGAHVVQGAFGVGSVAHHFTGGVGDVEQRPVGVGQLHLVQRTVGVQAAAVGVGVFVDGAFVGECRLSLVRLWRRGTFGWRMAIVLQVGPCAGQNHVLAGRWQPASGAGIHGDGGFGIIRPALQQGGVDGLAGAAGGQPKIGQGAVDAGHAEGLTRGQQRRVGIQRGQVLQPFGMGELGIAHVHHHHAGDEPAQKEQTEADAQPAVGEQQPAFDGDVHGGKSEPMVDGEQHAT